MLTSLRLDILFEFPIISITYKKIPYFLVR